MVADIRRKLDGMLDAWRYDFRYQLVAFGSTAYGLDTDSSDVDLCIIDPKRPDGFRSAADLYDLGDDPKKRQRLDLDPIYDVRRVAGALRRLGYPDVRPIPGAAVPIVKFTTREGIRADIVSFARAQVSFPSLLHCCFMAHTDCSWRATIAAFAEC